jgi:transposase
VLHPRAKLTVHGRRLLVERVLEQGWPPAEAARAQGVSVATCSKWLARYRAEGLAGLADPSCRPHRSPRRLAPEREQAIVAWRQTHRVGPHRIGWALGEARSTVWAVLARHRLPRLAELDRPSGLVVRYERLRPGELVHVDIKAQGRIPDGGGHRLLGELTGTGIGGSRPAMTTCMSPWMIGPGWPRWRPWPTSRARPRPPSPPEPWPGSPGWEFRWNRC